MTNNSNYLAYTAHWRAAHITAGVVRFERLRRAKPGGFRIRATIKQGDTISYRYAEDEVQLAGILSRELRGL